MRAVLFALSTGHKVGLAVVGAAFVVFALASSFLFPRIRPQYPGRGLPAFIVVAFLFFFGMLTAVEVFGAEPAEKTEEHVAVEESVTATTAPATTAARTTTTAKTTTRAATPAATTVDVTETEFKIALPSTTLKAGKLTFDVENDGKIQHDLAIKGMSEKSKLIDPGGTATLTADLKPGTYELYCSVPGHEAAGMKVTVTVS